MKEAIDDISDNFPIIKQAFYDRTTICCSLENLCVTMAISAEHFILFFSHLECKWVQAFIKRLIHSPSRNTVTEVQWQKHESIKFFYGYLHQSPGSWITKVCRKSKSGPCVCVHVHVLKPYLCPSSWATVNATGSPVSSLMLQLRWAWHMPATWDRPRVSQGTLTVAQMSFLWKRQASVEHSSTENDRKHLHLSCWRARMLESRLWFFFFMSIFN